MVIIKVLAIAKTDFHHFDERSLAIVFETFSQHTIYSPVE